MKKLLLILLCISFKISGSTCTTFFINKDGQMVFGRNYDWMTDVGMVCSNQRGLSKTSMKAEEGETISWISQYGSITFNQYGKEFPTGGMNEKGLVVELMWLDETKYAQPDQRPAVDVLQWIQYQLDNCATVEEVIATDKKIRISSVGNPPLHYLVADEKGNAATIEFLDGKMVLHKDADLPFPVLTNSVYKQSLDTYQRSAKGKNADFAYGNNSLERFSQACKMISEFKSNKSAYPLVDYSFDILAEVTQGDATKWSIVYDISKKTVYFKTNRFKSVKSVPFAALDFACPANPKAWDMNQESTGSIAAKMADFTLQLNQQIVEKAFAESRSQIQVSQDVIRSVWKFVENIACKTN